MKQAEHRIRAAAMPAYDRAALPVAESSMSRAERRRLAMTGGAIGLACLVACGLGGLLISVAVFG
jgi:hypothetical protein